jgi:membrane protease YdiL (CAAX protease family)
MQKQQRMTPLRSVFRGRLGLRAGWRLLLFLLLFAVCAGIPALLLGRLLPSIPAWAKAQSPDTLDPNFLVFQESWLALSLLLAVLIMSRIDKQPFLRYGLPWQAAFGRRFWLGALVGFGGVALQMALLAASGGYSPDAVALAAAGALKYALLWAAAFLFAALFEEFSFRGYLQVTLGSGLGFWPAAVLLSLAFAAAHLGNPGERWPGIAMLFCFGMLAAFTLRRTGDLWFIVGLHAAWDWAHIFVFSVPIAGMRGTGQLLHSSLHGPARLTGGSAGPDGSPFAFLVLLLIAVLVHRLFPDRKAGPAISAPAYKTDRQR